MRAIGGREFQFSSEDNQSDQYDPRDDCQRNQIVVINSEDVAKEDMAEVWGSVTPMCIAASDPL